jgi:hypothetical protein
MSRFANLADKAKGPSKQSRAIQDAVKPKGEVITATTPPPSRVGRKVIAAYFSTEMSMAMHVCARKHGLGLQGLMAEAFDDVLRKYGKAR